MEIDRGGLKVVMPQMILDVRNRMTIMEHIDCSAVAKTVNGINLSQALFRECLLKVFPANTIDSMTGERLALLIDKEPVPKQGFWGRSVFSNIQLKEIAGFGFKLYETEPIAFAQDAERLLAGIKIIEIQSCYFTGPGTGIIKQVEQQFPLGAKKPKNRAS